MEPGTLVISIIFWIVYYNSKNKSSSAQSPSATNAEYGMVARMIVSFIIGIFISFLGIPYFIIWIVLTWLPGTLLWWVIVPLGLPRITFIYSLIMVPWSTTLEATSGAALYGVLAWLRQTHKSHQALQFLANRLNRPRANPEGMFVAATGFLAIANGNAGYGRDLLRAVSRMHKGYCSRVAKRAARNWLVAEGLDRRDLITVMIEASRPNRIGWAGRLARKVRRKAQLEVAAATPFSIAVNYIPALNAITHSRKNNTNLLLRFGATNRWLAQTFADEVVLPDIDEDGNPLHNALQYHRAVLTADPIQPGYLNLLFQTCLLWDKVASDTELAARIQQRYLALRVQNTETDVQLQLINSARTDITALVAKLGTSLDFLAGSEMGESIIWHLRLRDFDDLQALVDTLQERTVPLAAIDEWCELSRIQYLTERMILWYGDAIGHEIFSIVYYPVNNWAVELLNTLKAKRLAHEAFRWLNDLSKDGDNQAASELLARNLALGWN